MAAAAAVQAGVTLGKKALDYAMANAPEIVDKAKAYVAVSNKDLGVMAKRVMDPKAQDAVLAALIRNGFDSVGFSLSSELTDDERRLLHAMTLKMGQQKRADSDKRVVAVGSSFDELNDYFCDIQEVCNVLNITPEALYALKRVLDRLTADVSDKYIDLKRKGQVFRRAGSPS